MSLTLELGTFLQDIRFNESQPISSTSFATPSPTRSASSSAGFDEAIVRSFARRLRRVRRPSRRGPAFPA